MTAPDREAVAVTQADRDEANKAFDIAFRGDTDGIDEAMAGLFARHRLAAIEEAARVAEARHEQWRFPYPDDAVPGEVCCDVSACRDIATAIRNLAAKDDSRG